MFPFTKTGMVFLALLCIAVGVYGIRRMDYVVFAAGLAGLTTIFVLLLCTLSGAFFLFFASRRAVTPGALDLATNLPQSTGYRVRFPRWVPCAIVRWSWENTGRVDALVFVEREKGWLSETVTSARRCISDRVTRCFYVRDIFGLTEISWRRTETIDLKVLPDRGLLTRTPPPFGVSDGDDIPEPWAAHCGDRVDMRPYVPGDSLRMVLWKIYARSGRMMVRIPERSVVESRRGCGYLVTGAGDDAAAAAARVAVERGLLGEDWRFGADGVDYCTAEKDEALKMIAISGGAYCEGRANEQALGSFLAKMRDDGYQSCILFVPPDHEAWNYVAAQTARGRSMRIQVVIGVESVGSAPHGVPGFARRAAGWFLRPENGAAARMEPTLEEIRRVVSCAPRLFHAVGIAERRTGDLHMNILNTGSASW
jgi:hypothetical protein